MKKERKQKTKIKCEALEKQEKKSKSKAVKEQKKIISEELQICHTTVFYNQNYHKDSSTNSV